LAGPVTDLLGASALAVGAAIRKGEVSASEVLELHLDRIADVNPRLNAIVTLCEDEARAAAAAADRATERGPLHGVPFTVKDSLATAGVRSTAGSRLLRDFVPTRDATVVARLKSAGAILLGKTNCPEFALDPITDNRLFGLTLNPVDETVTVGGSSGGDAAAVASGCAVFGIGSDYGGSIRWPAQCAGIAGMRPTPGLVPGTGGLPFPPGEELPAPSSVALLSRGQTIGPLARFVDDLWAVLRVLAGPDGIDPNTVPVPLSDPDTVDVRSLRCAWTDGEGTEPVHPDLVEAVERAAAALEELGLAVEQRRPSGLERAIGIFRLYRVADGLPVHLEVARGREEELAETMQSWSTTLGSPATVEEYQRHGAARDALRAEVLAFMESWPIVLLPVSTRPAFPLGSLDFAERFRNMAPCSAITLLGLPVVVVRVGSTRQGLPAGVQIVGRPFADHEVLAVARRLEEAL
jgi:Asp-tRNA(Asn)/Glu-tRNA(Gln) amidotransferase A subunit family amidase